MSGSGEEGDNDEGEEGGRIREKIVPQSQPLLARQHLTKDCLQ